MKKMDGGEENTNCNDIILRNAIVHGNYEKVNACVEKAKSVTVFLRPLVNTSKGANEDGESEEEYPGERLSPFDLAINHKQYRILRALIDHSIQETGVELFVDILLMSKIQNIHVVFRDLIERYPVAAYSFMERKVSFVKLKGHPIFKEALHFDSNILQDSEVFELMVKLERNELLRHPLICAHLSIQWTGLSWVYYFGFIFQLISAIIVTIYTLLRKHEIEDHNIRMIFRFLGITLTTIRAIYILLEVIRSIITYRKVLFRPLAIIKEGIFFVFVFGALIVEDSIHLWGRATMISWVRLALSLSNVPDRRCLYVSVFRSVVRVAVFEAGIASGIFFPLIGMFLGFHIVSKDGEKQSPESLGFLIGLIVFSVVVLTFLVGLSVAKVRNEVLSINGDDFVRSKKALGVHKYQKLLSFWSKVFKCCGRPNTLFACFSLLPKQFEDDNISWRARFLSNLRGEGSYLPIYRLIDEDKSDSLEFSNIQRTNYKISPQILYDIPHRNDGTHSGFTRLYWNNIYTSYYNLNYDNSRKQFIGKFNEGESSFKGIKLKESVVDYHLKKELILNELKRDVKET